MLPYEQANEISITTQYNEGLHCLKIIYFPKHKYFSMFGVWYNKIFRGMIYSDLETNIECDWNKTILGRHGYGYGWSSFHHVETRMWIMLESLYNILFYVLLKRRHFFIWDKSSSNKSSLETFIMIKYIIGVYISLY